MTVVIKNASYSLVAVPDFVQYGSKPERDISEQQDLKDKIYQNLRTYNELLNYPPHQAFIGNIKPEALYNIPKPWYDHPLEGASRYGPFGEIMPEEEFYGWMKAADDFDLLWLTSEFSSKIQEIFATHNYAPELNINKLKEGKSKDKIQEVLDKKTGIPLYFNNRLVGTMRRDHDKDESLQPIPLLENLMAKTSGVLAMKHLLQQADIKPEHIDFILDCTETAVGDRYNRGGGSMSKAMAEMCSCINATGHDVRAFCCAPNHALVTAAALVESGIYDNVLVVGGGCLAKIGMKYFSHLKNEMPLLEDVLGSIAFLVTKDDGFSPIIRLDALGKHDVVTGSAQESIMRALIIKPLNKIGMRMTDVDKYSTELHNPEITLPAGSGDTPAQNYKIMAALAAMNKDIDKNAINDFVYYRGMPGYCPTQGHVPSAVPYIGHAIKEIKEKKLQRVMFVAKGSLFLGRMSQLSDGISFMLESQSAR